MRVLVKRHRKRLYLWDPVCKRRFGRFGPYKHHVTAKGHRNPLHNQLFAKKKPEEEAAEAMYGIEEEDDSKAIKEIYSLFPGQKAAGRKLGITKTGPGQYQVSLGRPDVKAPVSTGEGALPMLLILAGLGALIWWGTRKQPAPTP